MIYPEMMLEEFQSTLPRGERHSRHPATCPFLDFNPRSREGSDGPLHCDCTAVHNFNPSSREGSDQTQASGPVFLSDFNPRSREGSDMGGRDVALPLRNISIHAPARGATHIHLILSKINPRFQSTLPRGERPNRTKEMYDRIIISIHAPARGATVDDIYCIFRVR